MNHDNIQNFQDNYIRCHWHSEIEVSIVECGCVLYQIRDTAYRHTSGCCLIINANTPHMMTPVSEDARIISIIFHPSLLYGFSGSSIEQNLIRPYLNSPKLAAISLLPEGGQQDLIDAFSSVVALYDDKPFAYELQIKSLLCGGFCDVLKSNRKQLQPGKSGKSPGLKTVAASTGLRTFPLWSSSVLNRDGCCGALYTRKLLPFL